MEQAWPIPYIPDIAHLDIGALAAFAVSILIVVLVNAEAQAFMATLLGDSRPEAKDRFHFIAFFHLDVLGTINFFLGGYGWARQIDIEPARFPHPRLYTVLTRLAGPLANFLMANIAASIIALLKSFQYEGRVFGMVAGVNITTAVFNLIPLPPLVAGVALTVLIPPRFGKIKAVAQQAGPFLILALTLLGRLYPEFSLHPYLDPLIHKILGIIAGS